MESRLAKVEFSNTWRSVKVLHKDRLLVPKFNFWRDILPNGMDRGWEKMGPGDSKSYQYETGQLLTFWTKKKLYSTFASQIALYWDNGEPIDYSPGRFYPRGLLIKLGFFHDDRGMFRVIAYENRKLEFDLNEPLSKYSMLLSGKVIEVLEDWNVRGGPCRDVPYLLTTNGIGLQAQHEKVETDFYRDHPFERESATPDQMFYESPRLVRHVDQVANNHITEVYLRYLKPGMKVLDLMSSWDSHLSGSQQSIAVTGIGLNQTEMEQNPYLSKHLVHDLNQNPILPLQNDDFDLAICSLSVEYLTQPKQVFEEIGRVLKPGAFFIITFSDHWFPAKVIRIWRMLHPFERMGLVLNYFKSSGKFENLYTESIRGYLRPLDDPHIKERRESDSIFVVLGQVKK